MDTQGSGKARKDQVTSRLPAMCSREAEKAEEKKMAWIPIGLGKKERVDDKVKP